MLKVQFLSKNYILTTQNVLPKNTHIALGILSKLILDKIWSFGIVCWAE